MVLVGLLLVLFSFSEAILENRLYFDLVIHCHEQYQRLVE